MSIIKEPPLPASSEQDRKFKDEIVVLCDSTDPDWKVGEEIEASVFMQAGYINRVEELNEEYSKYLPNTEFAVARRDGDIGGCVRIIHYDSETGFKTLNDINSGRLDMSEEGKRLLNDVEPTQMFEVGTLAVKKEFRAQPEDEGRLSVDLYGAIYAESQFHNCDNVLASFDEEYFTRFRDIFGLGVQPLGPATDYMGSPTVPVIMNMPKLYEHLGKTLPLVKERVDEVGNNIRHG